MSPLRQRGVSNIANVQHEQKLPRSLPMDHFIPLNRIYNVFITDYYITFYITLKCHKLKS